MDPPYPATPLGDRRVFSFRGGGGFGTFQGDPKGSREDSMYEKGVPPLMK